MHKHLLGAQCFINNLGVSNDVSDRLRIVQNSFINYPFTRCRLFVINLKTISWQSMPVYLGSLMRIHYPKFRNMTHALSLNVFTACVSETILKTMKAFKNNANNFIT